MPFRYSPIGTAFAWLALKGNIFMLRAALLFFVLAIFAILFGANGIAGVSMEAGKMLLFVFLALAVVSAVVGLVTGRTPRGLP